MANFWEAAPLAEEKVVPAAAPAKNFWDDAPVAGADSSPVLSKAQLQELVVQEAKANGVPPEIALRMINTESGWDPNALSEKGAKGLGQLMDGTAKDMGVTDPYDPVQNIRGSMKYMGIQLRDFEDLPTALAAYNAGPGTVRKYRGIPNYPETLNYIKKITGPSVNEQIATGFKKGVTDLVGGGLKGAANIGTTFYNAANAPVRLAQSMIGMEQNPDLDREEMTRALQSFGVDTNSLNFGVSKLGTELAGTVGTGTILANMARSVPGASAIPGLIEGLETGGLMAPGANIATRIGTGAAVGATGAGIVDPNAAPVGAGIGAGLPALSGIVSKVMDVATQMGKPAARAIAERLLKAAGISKDDAITAMANSTSPLVQNYRATVAQLLQNPTISTIEGQVASKAAGPIDAAKLAQQEAYTEALSGISPVDLSRSGMTTVNNGNVIGTRARGMERAAREDVSRNFDAIPDNEMQIMLPLDELDDINRTVTGPGVLGQSNSPGTVASTARRLSEPPPPDADALLNELETGLAPPPKPTQVPVPFSTFRNLRDSTAGYLKNLYQKPGQGKAQTALLEMRKSFDNTGDRIASGHLLDEETVSPEAIAAYNTARDAHQTKRIRFNEGPQGKLFKTGSDNQPLKGDAEIPGMFYGNGGKGFENMRDFNRLIDGDNPMAEALKNHAVNDMYATTAGAGKFDKPFIQHVATHKPANSQLFSQREQDVLQEISDLIKREVDAKALRGSVQIGKGNSQADIISNDVLYNPAIDILLNKLPWIGPLVGRPLLNSARGFSNTDRTRQLAELLANPEQLAQALDSPIVGEAGIDAIRQFMRMKELSQGSGLTSELFPQ